MTEPARSVARDLLLLAGATLLLVGPGIGLRDPWPPDEPRFILVAGEMLASSQWLVPVRAGEIYADKPPVFLWLEALVLALTGSRRLAFQLPSLASALLTVILTYDLGRRLWSRRVGLWSAGVLLASVQFVMQARSGQIDATLTALTTLGLYGVVRHGLLGPAWGWYLTGFAVMGLGVMTKGVGFLPALALIPLVWSHRRGWCRLGPPPDWRWWSGLAALLLALSLWLAPLLVVTLDGGPALTTYRDELLLGQTAERYVDPQGHREPPWYYLTVLPGLWLPASAALPWLLPAWRRRLRRRDARYLLLLGWVVLVLLFFSLSPGKRGVYLLPALPAFALAVGPLVPGLWRRIGLQRVGYALTLLLGLVALGGAAGIATAPRMVAAAAGTPVASLTAPLAILGTLAVVSGLVARPRRGFLALLATLAVAWWILGLWIYPVFDAERSGAALMAAARERLPTDAELAIVDWREQMILHADRPVTHFGYRTEVGEQARRGAAWVARVPSRRVLIPASLLEPCFRSGDAEPVALAHRHRWTVVGPTDVSGQCPGWPQTGIRYVPPYVVAVHARR